MNDTLVIRQEIHNFLVDETDDDTLSDEEVRLLNECREDREKHPETFTDWEDVKKELGLS